MSETALQKRRSPIVWTLLKIFLALILVWFVFSKTDLDSILALRERISVPWLIVGFGLFFLLTVLKAMQYYVLLGRKVKYPSVLNVVVVQNAVSNFIATGAGIASYLALFRMEQGVKLGRATITFLITKVGDLISIWLILLLTSLALWPQIVLLQGWVILLLVGMGLAIIFFFLAVWLRQGFVGLVERLSKKIHLDRIGIFRKGLDFLEALAAQEQRLVFRMVGMGVVYSLMYMLVTMAWVYACLRVFDVHIPWLVVVFVNDFMQLVSYVPVQIFGGLGVTEVLYLSLYGILGYAAGELAAALLGIRVLFYLMNLSTLIYLPLHTFFLANRNRSE
ncbi:MAG: hypothetical protein Kow002_00170 [Anaerolineales bacterium]